MTFDVGPNLTALGFTWLFLHYILPLLLVGVILLGLYLFFKSFIFPNLQLDPKYTTLVVLVILILLAVALASY